MQLRLQYCKIMNLHLFISSVKVCICCILSILAISADAYDITIESDYISSGLLPTFQSKDRPVSINGGGSFVTLMAAVGERDAILHNECLTTTNLNQWGYRSEWIDSFTGMVIRLNKGLPYLLPPSDIREDVWNRISSVFSPPTSPKMDNDMLYLALSNTGDVNLSEDKKDILNEIVPDASYINTSNPYWFPGLPYRTAYYASEIGEYFRHPFEKCYGSWEYGSSDCWNGKYIDDFCDTKGMDDFYVAKESGFCLANCDGWINYYSRCLAQFQWLWMTYVGDCPIKVGYREYEWIYSQEYEFEWVDTNDIAIVGRVYPIANGGKEKIKDPEYSGISMMWGADVSCHAYFRTELGGITVTVKRTLVEDHFFFKTNGYWCCGVYAVPIPEIESDSRIAYARYTSRTPSFKYDDKYQNHSKVGKDAGELSSVMMYSTSYDIDTYSDMKQDAVGGYVTGDSKKISCYENMVDKLIPKVENRYSIATAMAEISKTHDYKPELSSDSIYITFTPSKIVAYKAYYDSKYEEFAGYTKDFVNFDSWEPDVPDQPIHVLPELKEGTHEDIRVGYDSFNLYMCPFFAWHFPEWLKAKKEQDK